MLRGAVIGLGRMGLTHFSILNTHPQVEFVAVCDSSSFVLKNVARHLDVETYKDMGKMLHETQPDFALVATPTAMHAEAVKGALSCGAHVFVEKPFSLNPEQGRELYHLARDRGLVHQVGYVIRFSDIFMEVKRLLDAGAIGNIVTFKVEMNGPTVLHGAKGWNQRYFPAVVKPVRYFVRGFEFTRQLDYFIDRILQGKPSQVCSFRDGLDTDIVIDRIRRDGDNGGHTDG